MSVNSFEKINTLAILLESRHLRCLLDVNTLTEKLLGRVDVSFCTINVKTESAKKGDRISLYLTALGF